MPFVRLLVISDCCLMVACLVIIGLLVLLQKRNRLGSQMKNQRRHEQRGRHHREQQGAHRVSGTVASLRERERADELPYYPRGWILRDSIQRNCPRSDDLR